VIEQAHIELSTVLNLYHDIAITFWLPETEAALAQMERARSHVGFLLKRKSYAMQQLWI
jgi:hypothetical protein